jgi:hypothetical protein
MNPDPMEAPALSADFAQKVLRTADEARLRRRLGRGLAAALLVAYAGWWAVAARKPVHASDPALLASDFGWLEEVGVRPSDPNTLVFPDDLDSDEDDPFVVSLVSSL